MASDKQAWPHCQACEAGGSCRFQQVAQTLIAKAEVLLGLGRDDDAEDLIAAALQLCEEMHR